MKEVARVEREPPAEVLSFFSLLQVTAYVYGSYAVPSSVDSTVELYSGRTSATRSSRCCNLFGGSTYRRRHRHVPCGGRSYGCTLHSW